MKDFQKELKADVSSLKGIGPKKAIKLQKIGIRSISDFIFYFPRDYEDRRYVKNISEVNDGEIAFLRCRADLIVKGKNRYGKKNTLRLLATDDTGSLEVVFFNAAFMENTFLKNETYSFFGKITKRDGRTQMMHPDFAKWEENPSNGILPIYNLTQGILQNEMRKWIKSALTLIEGITDYLPIETIKRNRLCGLDYALHNIHFPEDVQKLKEAKYRLIFEELLFLQIGLLIIRGKLLEPGRGIAFSPNTPIDAFIQTLPYNLTNAQLRVLETIISDMEIPKVMSRLIQGDVGSGKTVLAAAAIYKAFQSGYQAVMMAPTELLARQHYLTMQELFKNFDLQIGFLSANISGNARKKLLSELITGEINLLIGTHAVIQPTVLFKNLGLVITDEQHRFGVNQRVLLSKKGVDPDILVMTATPIPRTLAIILYGDLDISVLDEMPPGRKKIITRITTKDDRKSAYAFIKEEIKNGRQAYVVAPLIEDSEVLDAKSATGLFDELSIEFKGFRTALIHGELKQTEKDAIMSSFNEGKIDVLIATVVIEVGINVPNATCILIENAERFGLAQLHQLRGRVGRAEYQSYCFLSTDTDSKLGIERTDIMQQTNDGFLIADKDLELRGPGEFFGTKQHGLPELKIANLIKHIKVLEQVRRESSVLLASDPNLIRREHAELKGHIEQMFEIVEGVIL